MTLQLVKGGGSTHEDTPQQDSETFVIFIGTISGHILSVTGNQAQYDTLMDAWFTGETIDLSGDGFETAIRVDDVCWVRKERLSVDADTGQSYEDTSDSGDTDVRPRWRRWIRFGRG